MTGFIKYDGNPVLGSEELGVCFDVVVTRPEGNKGKYRMDFSWRTRKSLAVTFSEDGIHWEEPTVTLAYDESTGWEDDINRNCVLFDEEAGLWRMWYTGQAHGHRYSYIGMATSEDGLHFHRASSQPLLYPERPFEGMSVMNPVVLRENGLWRMWYAAGETYEPNVLAYAESRDGYHWDKIPMNPIFTADSNHVWEQNRVGGPQMIRHGEWYYLFYIGYEDINTARIGVARSHNGISGFEKSSLNPLVFPTQGEWDADACYKPSVLYDEKNDRWLLWYNGRKGSREYIGLAIKQGEELFF